VNLSWTRTGDGALRALAGKRNLHEFSSGNGITDEVTVDRGHLGAALP
jgi:hypothetical protein